MSQPDDRRAHWEGVYSQKAANHVSWFQARPNVSLALINAYAPARDASIIDVGAGASTLVDHLLGEGRTSLVVLDLAESALASARARLGADAGKVRWIAADVTSWAPGFSVDLWHDRAVLHFLTEAPDQAAYAQTLRQALKPDGIAIIAGFAPGGPLKCSGLKIVQHDVTSLAALLGGEFELIEMRDETHTTPAGASQAFRYYVFKRRGQI